MINFKKAFSKDNLANSIVTLYSEQTDDFFFIEIGAGDGVTNDYMKKYISKYRWKGVFVEPIRHVFNELIDNYKGYHNLFFENVAISDQNEIRDFYRLKETSDKLPFWYKGLGTFNPEVILKHKNQIPNIEKYLIIEKVKCIIFKSLCEKYKVKKIDLLQIDTEGFDYAIIKSIDFNIIKPKMIRYEHKHLSSDEKRSCVGLLKANGYSTLEQAEDTLAFFKLTVITSAFPLCKRAWHNLSRLIGGGMQKSS